jgi:hypothetical protein
MPRTVDSNQKEYALSLMLRDNMGQRDIQRITGLSRPFLRKLAAEVGYQFPRNGVEVLSSAQMCANCGMFFRRPPSKLYRAKNSFCDIECKNAFQQGVNHPSWKVGKTLSSFSTWVQNQSEYKTWREEVLATYNYKCAISGRDYDLDVHHIFPKSLSYERAFDPSNGIVLNKEIHREIHDIIRKGAGFEEAIKFLENKYKHILPEDNSGKK